MSRTAPYYRVPVVIFAALVGGLYVYAKGGGSLYPSRTRITPAANSDDVAPPRIEFMMGSKSAPAFQEVPVAQVNANPPPEQPKRAVFPGSKSVILVSPSEVTPPANSSSRTEPACSRQQSALPAPRTMLPGSKSKTVVEPADIAPAPTNRRPPQPQPSPTSRPLLLPGSKSAGVVGPSTFTPSNTTQPRQPQPAYSQQQLQPAPRNSYPVQQPNNSLERPRNANNPRYKGTAR